MKNTISLLLRVLTPSIPVTSFKSTATVVRKIFYFAVLADPCMADRSCCANEAVCHVSSTAPNGYECKCPDGFSGVNCQFRSCTIQPCQNGGTCTVSVLLT